MTKRLSVQTTAFAGLMLVERLPQADERGSLQRLFCAEEMEIAGWTTSIAQVNFTQTHGMGTVRGLHYQIKPVAEAKLVTCLRGKVYDVSVDLRTGTETFLQCFTIELSPAALISILIPPGFAHGFQALTNDVEMLYLHSAQHNPKYERGVHPLDRRLGIVWPVPIGRISVRDANLPAITDSFEGIEM